MFRYILLLWLFPVAVLIAGCQYTNDAAAPATVEGLLSSVPSLAELAGTPQVAVPPLPVLDAAEVAQGQGLYAVHCASCHGFELEGAADWQLQNEDGTFRAPPHDASGHTWHHGDKTLLESIRLGGGRLSQGIGGVSEMPAFKDVLNEAQMSSILAYIKSTWPDDIRQVQWERTIREP